MRRRINEIVGQKSTAVQDRISLFIFRGKIWIGGSHQEIFTVDLVAAFGEEADIRRRRGTEIEHAQRRIGFPHACEFAETAGTPSQFLGALWCSRLCPARRTAKKLH